jgi:hypothetical protein
MPVLSKFPDPKTYLVCLIIDLGIGTLRNVSAVWASAQRLLILEVNATCRVLDMRVPIVVVTVA